MVLTEFRSRGSRDLFLYLGTLEAVDHQRTLARITEWATSDDNIRALVLTGSGARGAGEMDDLSDLDIELYVASTSDLLDGSAWYEAFGDVLVVEKMPNPGWFPTRLVNYSFGKVDFMIAPASALTTVEYIRPFRVLLDKDGISDHLHLAPLPVKPPPTREEFIECVNWFYAEVFMCAKCLVREELWMAKFRECSYMTEMLRMIEWDHQGRYGPDIDTWYQGTHWREWMDADLRRDLATCWGAFEARDMSRALSDAATLFSQVARRTSTSLSGEAFDYDRLNSRVSDILSQSTDDSS
jgi:aminoglycoside 6-adenylyltransferase